MRKHTRTSHLGLKAFHDKKQAGKLRKTAKNQQNQVLNL